MWKQSSKLLASYVGKAKPLRPYWFRLQLPFAQATQDFNCNSLQQQLRLYAWTSQLFIPVAEKGLDVNYRSPTERIWPASPRQQKVASRVIRALESALCETPFLETMVKQYGFCVEEVRMSPDMLTAFVLWSAHPEYELSTQKELQQRMSKLRVAMGRALKAKHVPRLEFRLNQLTASQEAVEHELKRLRPELT